MSNLDFSGLSDMAKAPERAVKGAWRPLEQSDLGEGLVLAFDQSLTATGWVRVVSIPGFTQVMAAGKFKAPEGDNSIETQLRRSVAVFEQTVATMDLVVGQGYALAHESPPNPAAVKGSGIGSLMAATAVRNAAAVFDTPIEMLGAQPGKKLICGSAKADKSAAHKVLKETCFPWVVGSELVTNEATRDALMVALLWLYRRG